MAVKYKISEIETLIALNEKTLSRITDPTDKHNIQERLSKYYQLKNRMLSKSMLNWTTVLRASSMNLT